ncbi:helix-turn-helix domain-containing protein [Kurthia huakuii]|uniref:helix-turn-helix domain-containing protein n=1 Tax=Kurthia huakuii TaxID=1421019 RepID=UPI000496DDBB|nr:helix-turn-helix transcriptional regulator [Kurthia huakuii]MBM7698654.1 transcriptional regulator with XRE-family HTH domain [Kurthia huakuii]
MAIFCVKEMREYRGITRYRLAQLSGLSNSTLQDIENNSNPNPTFRSMCKIADALEVSLDDLRREE